MFDDVIANRLKQDEKNIYVAQELLRLLLLEESNRMEQIRIVKILREMIPEYYTHDPMQHSDTGWNISKLPKDCERL